MLLITILDFELRIDGTFKEILLDFNKLTKIMYLIGKVILSNIIWNKLHTKSLRWSSLLREESLM